MFSTSLIAAFEKLQPGPDMSTRDFAEACAAILPIFDHLGTPTTIVAPYLGERRCFGGWEWGEGPVFSVALFVPS